MIRRTITTATALFETGMRAADFTDAASKVGQDWQAISQGIAHPETVFAIVVIVDATLRIVTWAVRKVAEAIKARRESEVHADEQRANDAPGIDPGT